MQHSQASRQVGRYVLVRALSSRAVCRFRDVDLREARQHSLHPDTAFEASQWGAETEVDSISEGKVLTGIGPIQAKVIRALELSWIAIGGADNDHHG